MMLAALVALVFMVVAVVRSNRVPAYTPPDGLPQNAPAVPGTGTR